MSLLWALLFSIAATIVLQEMAVRLGLATGQGLGEAVRGRFRSGAPRIAAVGFVVCAIALGNAAYETGNLLGAGLGIESVLGGRTRAWGLAVGALAGMLLWTGSYRLLERALVGMVAVMGVTFLTTAVALAPDMGELVHGLLVPTLPEVDRALLLVIALIGTTVVPYNLFLHAAAVRERWDGPEAIGEARADAVVAIVAGGIISMAIVVTAAGAAFGERIVDAADMAVQLEPLLGGWARAFFAIGLLAAGLSSAITAPLAAAWATSGALGWGGSLRSPRFRAVWIGVLATGMLCAALGVRPVPAILFAQVANGLLLPAIAVFLLLAANDRSRMGRWTNGRALNAIGILVVLVTLALGLRAVAGAV